VNHLRLDWARSSLNMAVQIVKRSDDATGFVVLPRHRVVERTLAWIARHRRCVRDYKRLPEHHEAMVRWSMIRIASQRLTKPVQERALRLKLRLNDSGPVTVNHGDRP
jgi:transposase